MTDVYGELSTALVHSKELSVGQRRDEVAGLIKKDLLEEVT